MIGVIILTFILIFAYEFIMNIVFEYNIKMLENTGCVFRPLKLKKWPWKPENDT